MTTKANQPSTSWPPVVGWPPAVGIVSRELVSPMHLTLRLKRLEEMEVEQARAIRDEWTEVSRQMRQRREAADVSLRKLAQHLNVSAPYVSDMERGARRYSLRYVTKALELFGANHAISTTCKPKE